MTLPVRPDVLDFLSTRRSSPARLLAGPGPSRPALENLLGMAVRVPDHGKLEPWRLTVLEGAALERLAAITRRRGKDLGHAPDKLAKDADSFENSPVVVAVTTREVPGAKVPVVEQHLSAGAVCLSLVNAALASGWGASWLTGWMAYDRAWLHEALDLSDPDFVAGFIHIGAASQRAPERPRPDLSAITNWITA
ncbi:nitroreductase family protein [Pontivivens insulae]|uniref:Putative NAD(P)H nitroreductase n=1 Tax=Pontivivens insulae TaxID=1639689 RepID=A0A2R8AF26_9RHOB|nr:nitroreductase [Pontivivens insulae]SPF30853.1 Putative NAD(P)H nitroreductase YdjA [Pontivivens insulae]